MSSSQVSVTMDQDVAVVCLDRPGRWNAFDRAMFQGLEKACDNIMDHNPRAVVVTGAGDKAFCAGMDVNPDNPHINNLVESVMAGNRGPVEELLQYLRRVVDKLVFLPVPVIAAVNGAAYGGGAELATRCDMRVMDPAAILRFSEVRMGLMPDWGGGVALTRLVGPSRAADLVCTAREVAAQEALSIGLANRVSQPGKCLEEAMDLARAISQNGPQAVRHGLALIRRTPDLPVKDALELETELATRLIAGGECLHGVAAFLEKKDPVFPDVEEKKDS